MADDDFDIRPGRSRDAVASAYRKAGTLVGRVLQVSRRAGVTPLGRARGKKGTGRFGRGKRAALQRSRSTFQRRVIVKARVVRHKGARFSSAPLARHIAYLERDGATRGGSDVAVFDAGADCADGEAFAARCEEDRHHFRFIVSPEDASEMADLRAFTRELMQDVAGDLGTGIDWVAVDHWNTDNPHVHVLVRGAGPDGKDLVIDRAYIGEGLRGRAQERVTAELGPRSEREIRNALRKEVSAERWTGLDRALRNRRDDLGVIDLHPEAASGRRADRTFLIGRAQVLERMGLAERVGPASWTLAEDIEPALRALGERGDIIKTVHRAMTGQGLTAEPARYELHGASGAKRVIGRLVERGLHDELTGEAYAIVEGTDGRTHHFRFSDLQRTGDAAPGAIVETGAWTDRGGRTRSSLTVRSDLPVEAQIHARGSTWLDRQLVSPRPESLSGEFGEAVKQALERRGQVLVDEDLARRRGARLVLVPDLLAALRERDLSEAGDALGARRGRTFLRTATGERVSGIYRERVTLASGRFAMIDDGMGFRLVPWRQDIEPHLGRAVAGIMNARGGVDWSFSRMRGPAL